MAEHLSASPGLLPELLRSLFDLVLFEEHSNQWSLSRPMLSLILVLGPHYESIKQQVCLWVCYCVSF